MPGLLDRLAILVQAGVDQLLHRFETAAETQLSAVALEKTIDSPRLYCEIAPSLSDRLAILVHADCDQLLHRFETAADSAQCSRACSNTRLTVLLLQDRTESS